MVNTNTYKVSVIDICKDMFKIDETVVNGNSKLSVVLRVVAPAFPSSISRVHLLK